MIKVDKGQIEIKGPEPTIGAEVQIMFINVYDSLKEKEFAIGYCDYIYQNLCDAFYEYKDLDLECSFREFYQNKIDVQNKILEILDYNTKEVNNLLKNLNYLI